MFVDAGADDMVKISSISSKSQAQAKRCRNLGSEEGKLHRHEDLIALEVYIVYHTEELVALRKKRL